MNHTFQTRIESRHEHSGRALISRFPEITSLRHGLITTVIKISAQTSPDSFVYLSNAAIVISKSTQDLQPG